MASQNKKTPPAIPTKPKILGGKPEVSKKPTGKPTNGFDNEERKVVPSFSSNQSNSFKENLNKKLTLPFQPPSKQHFKLQEPNIQNNSNNRNSIVNELNGILSQSKHSNEARTEYGRRNHDNPKSDRTISLTEVSTLKTEDKSTKYMNDTLEMMTDEGFDTTNDELALDVNGDIELSPDEDDDELFAQFSIPPPPPPAIDFSDSEAELSFKEQDVAETGSCSSTESLSCAFEIFVPPPPPPDLINETDDEDEELSLTASTPEFDDCNDETTDTQVGFHEGHSTIQRRDTALKKPSSPQGLQRNLLVDELQSKMQSISNIHSTQTPPTYKKEVKGSPPIAVKANDHKEEESDSDADESDGLLPDDSFEEMNIVTDNRTDISTKKVNPVISSVSRVIQKDLKNKNDNVLQELSKVNLSGVSNKRLFQEPDSGHGTARSVEISDTESAAAKENPLKLKSDDNKVLSRGSSTSSLQSNRTARKTSTVSKTWSSFSSGIDDDDELDRYNDKDAKMKPKVNLRDLMKKMKTFDSEDSEDEIVNLVTTTNNREIENEKSIKYQQENDDDDDEDSVHFSDSEVETHLNDLDVTEWTTDDVSEWLELIGLMHLTRKFHDRGIDGKALSNLDMKLLDEMKITSSEDQELILSEVYALQNPADADMEVSMLDQLDKASGEEREKMLSLLSALQEPSNDSFINSYTLSTKVNESGLNSSMDKSQGGIDRQLAIESPINAAEETVQHKVPSEINDQENTLSLMQKLAADVFDPTMDGSGSSVKAMSPSKTTTNSEKQTKKKKKKGFFASLRRGKGKKKNNDSNDITDASLSNLNPQGMLKVLATQPGKSESIEIPLLASMTTSARDVCDMCLQYLHLTEDVKCYNVAISRIDRKVENIDLNADECPLVFQSKWDNLNTYRFELKHNPSGYIIVNNEDSCQEEIVSLKLAVSHTTTAKDIIPVLLKRLKEKDDADQFKLKQTDKDEYIDEFAPLLRLPLSGYKFHVFKLVNISASSSSSSSKGSARVHSFAEVKKMETKCSLLEKQIEGLTTQLREAKSTEASLLEQNKKFKETVSTLNDNVSDKNEEIKKLQDEITNMSLTERTRQLVSPAPDNELRLENVNLSGDLQKANYQVSHLQQMTKTLKDSNMTLEKENEQSVQRNQMLLTKNEEFRMKVEQLECENKSKTSNSGEQMKRLYVENKEHLRTINALEEKLSDIDYKYSQLKTEKETDGAENSELRIREETLESQLLEKDSKLLEMEYKLQKKERSIREIEDQLEDEKRKRKKDIETKESFERRNEDLSIKLENVRQQLNEKEKQIQSVKNQINKQEKKLSRQKTIVDQERAFKEEESQKLKRQMESEIKVLQEKLESLQKLHVEKNVHQKQKEFILNKTNEELQVAVTELDRKLASKDVVIERLEEKVARSDLSIESKLQVHKDSIQSKEEKVHELEMVVARLENEQASKNRESLNAIRVKDTDIAKLESRLKKLELSNRDGTRKFEKFTSEKDRLLMQMNDDREKEVKELKTRVRQREEAFNEKESQCKDLKRKGTEIKKNYEGRLKKRDKEFKQQKYLLEKILELVNSKAPSLLRQLQDTIDDEQSPMNLSRRSNSETSTVEDEWC